MFYAEVLPFDQVAELSVHHFAVHNFFHHPFFFTLDDFWERRWGCSSAWYRIGRCQCQFDDIEDGVESLH